MARRRVLSTLSYFNPLIFQQLLELPSVQPRARVQVLVMFWRLPVVNVATVFQPNPLINRLCEKVTMFIKLYLVANLNNVAKCLNVEPNLNKIQLHLEFGGKCFRLMKNMFTKSLLALKAYDRA